ncbi:phosphotransferase [Streptomyces sp. NBC_00063]|uniref:phosphotransferase n=1 Tax=Streptomyces sp. NBC_00063 TaxID=2975638 RepID=UPI003EB9F321
MLDTLVDLHALEPAAVGLGAFGRTEGFLERQLSCWQEQLVASHSRPVAGAAELHGRLARTLSASPSPTVVHGDYRLGSTLVGEDGRIRAVLAWEM